MLFIPTYTLKQNFHQSLPGLSDIHHGLIQPLGRLYSQALYRAGRSLVSAYMRFALDLDIHHHAPLPEGPMILAANHPTTTDPFYLLRLLKKPLSVLVMSGAFEVPLFGFYLRAAGQVPALRGSGGATVDALARVIESGRSAAIFPEGALTPLDGYIGEPHSGLARVALRTGAPVIPVGIGLDRERIQVTRIEMKDGPVTGHLYSTGPYAMTVGRPIHLEGKPADRAAVNTASIQVMRQIKTLAAESEKRLGLASPRANRAAPLSMGPTLQAAK